MKQVSSRFCGGVPYEEIDVELRRLVRLMNSIAGIETIASCVGHEQDSEAVVSFIAADLVALQAFARRLPFYGVRHRLAAGHPAMESIVILTYFHSDVGLFHELRIGGDADVRSAPTRGCCRTRVKRATTLTGWDLVRVTVYAASWACSSCHHFL